MLDVLVEPGDSEGDEIVAACTSIDPTQLPDLMASFIKYFMEGRVSSQRMVELLLVPFIKLARYINKASFKANNPDSSTQTSQGGVCWVSPEAMDVATKEFYCVWMIDIRSTVGAYCPSTLPPSKHAELIEAVFGANIPEVSKYWHLFRF